MGITRKTIKIGYIKREQKIAKSGKNEGKEYTSISIKVEGRGAWLNGFGAKSNEHWQKGDEIEVDIESKEWNGKTYYNIKNPSSKISQEDFNALGDRVQALEREIISMKVNLGMSNSVSGVVESEEIKENLPI